MNEGNTQNNINNIYTSKYITSNDNYISKIKNIFNIIIENNKERNIIKSILFSFPNFNSKLLFQEIDSNQKNFINSLDLINYLNKFSINCNEQIIRRLIQQYDKHNHFRLIYDDFKELISPNKEIKIQEEKNINNNINLDKNELFNSIIKNEINLIIMINKIIIDIKNCENFITYEAFMSISQNEKNIDKNTMKIFIGDKYDEDDINYLIYYLDMNNNGLISYDEFEDFFMPISISQEEENNIITNFENKLIIKNNKEIIDNNLNVNNNGKEKLINDNIKNNENEKEIFNNIEKKYENKDINENKNDININNYESKNAYNIKKEFNNNKNKRIEENKYKNIDKDNYYKNNIFDNKINLNDNLINEKNVKNEYNEIENYNKKNNIKQENNNNSIYKDDKEDKYLSYIKKNLKINNYDEPILDINNNQTSKLNLNKESEEDKTRNNKENQENYNLKSNYNLKERIVVNENNNNIDLKQNSKDDYNYSNSNNDIDNYNDSNIIEGIEYNNKESDSNNNNDYNNFNISNKFSGNISSSDFNKSDNFIYENNINDYQKNNFEQNNNISKINNKNLKNNLNIEDEKNKYVENNYIMDKNNNKKEKEFLIQKNTIVEIKKDNNVLNKSKENNIKELLNLRINKNDEKSLGDNRIINLKDNFNNADNNSMNSNSHPININGSIFTCGENLSIKTNNKDSDVDEYKIKYNNKINNNNLENINNITKNDKNSNELNINQNLMEESQNDFSEEEENQINYFNDKYSQKDKYIKIKNNKKEEIISNLKKEEFKEKITEIKLYNENKYNFENNKNEKKYNKNINNDELISQETEIMTNNFLQNKYRNNNNNNENKKYNNDINNFNNNDDIHLYDKIKVSQKYSLSNENDNNKQLKILNSPENHYSFNQKNNKVINLFLDYIDNILKNENICYSLKESLSLREDITFKELFCLFDYHQNKNISIHEFKKVCKNILSIYPTTDQIKLIFSRYDINKDEKLDLKEFLNMISPMKKEYLGILFGDKKVQKPFHSELSDKSKKLIVNLMKTIILNETNYYEIREKMKLENFSINDTWNNLIYFSKNKNTLNLNEFGNFLKSNSFNLTQYEISIIFNKFDFDKDELINFEDFNHEFIM